jgi:hypothetical protein
MFKLTFTTEIQGTSREAVEQLYGEIIRAVIVENNALADDSAHAIVMGPDGPSIDGIDEVEDGLGEVIAEHAAAIDELAIPAASELTKLPVWRVTARYSDGQYWGDDVSGKDRSAAILAACDAMVEAGESDRNSIEIVDCDLVDHVADAAPDLLAALVALLPEIDSEIEQRQHGGNDEDWASLQKLSDAGHAAVRKARGE